MKNNLQFSFEKINFKSMIYSKINLLPKWIFMLLFIPFSNEVKAQCFTPPTYCTGIGANNVGGYAMGFQNIKFGTTAVPLQINNTTPSGAGSPIYFNYTNLIVRAAASDTVFYTVQVGNGNSTTFRIFIDYNNDGTFGVVLPELVYTSAQITASGLVSGFFVIPATLSAGAYRIRMASDGLNQIPPPCGPSFYSAEYEDYTLLVPATTADLMSGAFTSPNAAIVGNNTVSFNVTNISTTTITSVDINYQLDLNTPVTQSLSSISILPGATYNAVFSTQVALPSTGSFGLKAWTNNPNFSGNNTPGNDTVCRTLVTYCSGPLSGTYTVNPNGLGTTNYKTFGGIDSALISCGVSGAVTVNVTPGIYNENLIISAIPGASATNNITFNGNGSTLQFNCDATNIAVLRFQAVKHVTLDSLTFKSTSVNFGWGVHFFQNCDSNTVRNSIIDLTAVTSTTASNSAGIVFSNSTSSPTTTGNTCVRNNIINNQINGHPTLGGMYYGIVGAPATSSATFTANRFVNNTIRNFYLYGIYWSNSNRTLFRKNLITRPTKTSVTTTYAFYLSNGSRADTIDANNITNLFGGSPTNANTTFIFYCINYSGLLFEPNIITNNLVHNIKGDGPLYGFYLLSSFNQRIYNNTLLFDNTSSTSATATTYGLYSNTSTSTGSTLDFRNNIISITRTGNSTKNAIFTAGSFASGATFNKNAYFSNSPNYALCNYVGVNYVTLTNWKAGVPTLDQQSIDFAPNFVNPVTANYSPRDGAYDGTGDNLIAFAPLDYTGAARALPMDIGAFEASPIALDAAMSEIVFPVAPYTAGLQTISAKIRNAGTTTLTSATLNWSLNGVTQTPVLYTGSLAGGTVSANISLGTITIAANTLYNIQVWVTSPNGLADPNTSNDLLGGLTASQVSGTVTINAAGSGPGVFTSFTNFAALLKIGGLGGAVTANVLTGSGPYTEQVFFDVIPGSSATNTITINGNGETLQFDNTNPSSIGIFNLLGTDYLTLNNLSIRSLNASYGVGVILTSAANYNKIQNCTINIGSVTGSSLSAGIAFTSSLGSPTNSGVNGSFNLIENNLITGNSTGGPYYGISYNPTNTSNATNTFNIIKNNNIRDFTVYGFYITYSAGSMISGNTLWRPTKSSPTTFFGFYGVNGMAQDTFENNIIKQPFQMLQTTTNQFYGYYLIATNVQATRPLIFRNNQMYDIKSNGVIYGIYQLSASNLRFYNNTFIVDHAASTSTGVTYLYYNSGTPTTTILRNNIFFLNRGGSASKYIYYLATTGAGYVINNNAVHLKQAGTNNFVGYYAANFATLAAWRTVNTNAYDQNSVAADPLFRLNIGPEYYQPGNDTLNNIGFATTDVPRDVTGALRSATPDLGAYEFSVPAADAGVSRLLSPLSPLTLGFQNVDVRIKSYGAATLTSANVGWQINGVNQTPTSWFGSLNNGDSVTHTAGVFNFATPGFYRIKAWSSLPNGVNDSLNLNDTINVTVCTPLAGYYTVNPALAVSDTNFLSVKSFIQTIQLCGVAGPINLQVSPGVYNGELTINMGIPGLSATNNVLINGADSATTRIIHDGSVQRATILMNGAKHFTFRNLSIEATAASGGGYGVLFTNAADSNKLIRCSIKTALLTVGFSTFAPIISSGNIMNPNTAGNNGSFISIDSCRLVGGYYGASFYNTTAPKAIGNSITNSDFIQPFYSGIYAFWQNQLIFHKNRVLNTGNFVNTSSFAGYLYQCDNGITITKNQFLGQLGGYGLYLFQNNGTSTSRNIIANNMIQLGSGSFTSFGIFDAGNLFNDIAHNSINNTSGDASYVSCALYYSYANPTTSNNARIVNNVFSSPNGAMAVWCANTASLSLTTILVNNNVYNSPSTYPFRTVNTISQTLANYRAALGLIVPNIDTNSIWAQPSYFSTTNLRSISPQLDSMGFVLATVTDDIDGNARSLNAPDAGVNEFSRPGEDIGVVSILQPAQPVAIGQTNVRVVIRNFGLNTVTTANVSYKVDTLIRTRSYSGTLLPGASDTVLFDSTSGPLGSNQRYNFTGALVTMKAYTTMPNSIVDPQTLNDTAQVSFCGSLSGVYTINPAGSGVSNFLTFADAINKLNCGGVLGNVTFNVASGTYSGQLDFTTIMGTSDSAKITIKSLTNNAADVILTSSTSNTLDNYTVRLRGVSYINLERLTIRNTNPTFGRVLSINKLTSNNTNTSNVLVKNCVLEGINTTSTADQYAVVFGPNGDNASNLSFLSNNIRFGSYSIYLGGQNIINLYTPGLVIDSNVFYQAYWSSLYLLSRNNPKIRGNFVDGSPTYGYYSYFLSGVSGDVEVVGNNIQNNAGIYGLYLAQCNYYGEVGLARVVNNVINMNGTSTQYGIYFANSSSTYFVNNTVRCASPSTATYAYYIFGNTTSGTVPQVVATNNVRFYNNILFSNLGYASYYQNLNAVTGTSESNNNLYYSGATNFSFINNVNYTPAQLNTTFRNSIYSGNDRRSLFSNINFTSTTDLKPLVSNATAWAANGRGVQSFFVNKDITGAIRSQAVVNGATDIGAYEFTPTVVPANLTITGSIGGGNTQHLLAYGDTVARIVWAFSGTLPSSINATYHTGALISDPTNGGRNPGSHYMDVFWRINASGGSSYNYDLSLNFDPNMLGTVPSMSDIKLAKKQTGVNGTWTHFGSTMTSVDTINNNFGVIGLSNFSDFTGTTDFAPLPVSLSKFEAIANKDDALLFWNTASELNTKSFEIERASNNVKFEKINVLAAAGNSNKLLSYSFEDKDAANIYSSKQVYYRLKMFDFDGSFTYSPIRVVDFNEDVKNEVVIYPNPFNDKLNIGFSKIEGESVQVEIIDLFGKICYKEVQNINAMNPEVMIPSLSKLSNGIYLIKVQNGSETVTRKLIKE